MERSEMDEKFRIGENFSLPSELVTQTIALLAKRGAGKTYCASVIAEEMLKARQQVVIVDPVGALWGLKSSADGKHEGFSIVVFGGEHGDVPLEESAGEIVASAIVEHRFSAIIDLSLFRKGEMNRFMGLFLETLYRLNRTALHLIVDEADAFAPQKVFGDEARTLGAMEDVVRRGRRRGIGCTLISQRPQVLNKNVLTQCEILCALRLVHPKDIDAIEEWVNVHADPERAKEMISSLPSLPIGTAWFWAPGWGDIFTRVKIRERETFDSSATPKVGKAEIKPTVLAPVDIERLGSKIQATVQKAKDNDPQALRRRIAELERAQKKIEPDPETVQRATEEGFKKCQRQMQDEINRLRKALDKMMEGLTQISKTVVNQIDYYAGLNINSFSPIPPRTLPRIEDLPKISKGAALLVKRAVRATHDNPKPGSLVLASPGGKLRAGAERMLAALVQWSPQGMHEGQMRSHAGMKRSGTFSTYMSDLRTRGLIEFRDGMLFATQAGIDYFGGNVPPAPASTEEVLRVWEPKLRDGARRILRILVEAGGDPLDLDALAEAAGMARSGTFSTYLSDLRTAKLIITGGGQARANSDTLFL